MIQHLFGFTSKPPKKQSGDYHIGRSRGGLTTKLHLRVNAHGLPLQIELSADDADDAPMAATLLKGLPRGAHLLADRGYDPDWIRITIYEQGCTPVIPPKSNRKDMLYYSKRQYKKRNLVERCFNKLKQFWHVATRYDRHASANLVFAKLAAVPLWLRFCESVAKSAEKIQHKPTSSNGGTEHLELP